MSNEVMIWDYLKSQGLNDYAVAGIMGNLYAESGLNPQILQINYQSSLGMSSEEYTRSVDNGTYGNFVKDAAGYGLAQWTFWSRKEGLLNLSKKEHESVGDLTIQLMFLVSELKEFGLWNKLNSCQSVEEASNLILFEYEKPYDMGKSVQNARANWSKQYYDKYHDKGIQDYPPVYTPVGGGQEYCVVACAKFQDKATASQQLGVLKGYGFDGLLIPVEK